MDRSGPICRDGLDVADLNERPGRCDPQLRRSGPRHEFVDGAFDGEVVVPNHVGPAGPTRSAGDRPTRRPIGWMIQFVSYVRLSSLTLGPSQAGQPDLLE
jgi:hypothetical protein